MMNLKQTMQDVFEQNILSYWIDHKIIQAHPD